MNYLKKFSELKNKYFALRHGQSEANVQGIIAGDPSIATKKFGLTEKGRGQIKETIEKVAKESPDLFNGETIVYSSDFLRTSQTAQIAEEILHTEPFFFTEKLRERFFGDFEGKDHLLYQQTWIEDEKDPNNKVNNVESCNEVLDRTTKLVEELEQKYSGKVILLVSHGDPIQILQTGFLKTNPANHRTLPTVQTGELRELKIVDSNKKTKN